MKNLFLIILLMTVDRSLSISQIIKGKVVFKDNDNYEPLSAVAINIDTIYYLTGLNGTFQINTVKIKSDSIIFKASYFATIKLINLPLNFDTLDLGTIEMIEHKMISQDQYDSIRNILIKTFEPDIIIVQRSKADKILKRKYSPIYHWAELLGYLVNDELISNKMINPVDKANEIIFNYDTISDLILLDYKK